MKFALFALALAGCTDHYAGIDIAPASGPPLGIGLIGHYLVTQDLCEGGIDGGCGNPVYLSNMAVAVDTGTAVEVGSIHPFDGTDSSFELTGVAEGNAVVAVTGYDDVTATFPFSVADVAATTLFVSRHTDPVFGVTFPDVLSPVHAFAGSDIAFEQRSVGADQSPRSGRAPVTLDPGTTSVAFDATCFTADDASRGCVHTGATLGTATAATPLTTLELDVVDASAIADFNMGAPTIELVDTLATNEIFLLPNDAGGHPIVGRGPDPVITINDPSIVTFGPDPGRRMRSFQLFTLKPGTTTLDITWGTVPRTFTVHVVPLN
jgi:hypothetical protein